MPQEHEACRHLQTIPGFGPVVALANKMARMGWAILAYKTTYEERGIPEALVAH